MVLDKVLSELPSKAAIVPGLITTALGLTVGQWVAIGGLVCTCVGVWINWHFKNKNFELALRKARGEFDDEI